MGKYEKEFIIGLDLGTTSVGWSCVAVDDDKQPKRIIAAGNYIFPALEEGKNAKIVNRRNKRSSRRQIRRKKFRKQQIKNYFINRNWLSKYEVDHFFGPDAPQRLKDLQNNPYSIKTRGIKEKLTEEELFIILIHYSKNRGYKSNRKITQENIDVLNNKSGDDGKIILNSIKDNIIKMGDNKYPSVYLNSKINNNEKCTNRGKNYQFMFTREQIADECKSILNKQYELGLIEKNDIDNLMNLVFSQRDFSDGPGGNSIYANPISRMRGLCKYDGEKRAPINAPSYKIFKMLQKISNAKFESVSTGEIISFEADDYKEIIEKSLNKKTIKFLDVLKIVENKYKDKFIITNEIVSKQKIAQKMEKQDKTEFQAKNEVVNSIVLLDSKFNLKYAMEILNKSNVNCSITDKIRLLDEISILLTLYKTEDKILKVLDDNSNSEIQKLINECHCNSLLKKAIIENFDDKDLTGFGKLSFNMLYKIINDYCNNGSSKILQEKSFETLPEIVDKVPSLDQHMVDNHQEYSVTNRAVKNTVNNAIDIVNAIMRKYGTPLEIHIEMARDLGLSSTERKAIENQNNENFDRKLKEKFRMMEEFPGVFQSVNAIRGEHLLKYRLWKRQDETDLYAILNGDEDHIDRKNLFRAGWYEIDHIVPYSESYDDSINNKVLTARKYNNEKGNKLPLETTNDEINITKYKRKVNLLFDDKKYIKLKTCLLAEKITKEMRKEFNSRRLNDTRYASLETKKILEFYLGSEVAIKSYPSSVTADLRNSWKLNGLTHSYRNENYSINNEADKMIESLLEQYDDFENIPKEELKIIEEKIIAKDRGNNLHHAVDATIIACANESLLQKISKFRAGKLGSDFYNKYDSKEHKFLKSRYNSNDKITKFPLPYLNFVDEVKIRIFEQDEDIMKEKLKQLSNYDQEAIN